jgi:YhcH/YjgK/YiaL family protein
MIVDSLRNAKLYYGISEDIKQGLIFLESIQKDIKLGTYEISKKVRVLVTEYDTKVENPNRFESHKHVIDIQYPIIGLEAIEWSPLDGMTRITEYDEGKDVTFYNEPRQTVKIVLGNGTFGIFFRDDAHNPALAAGSFSHKIKKATVKVSVD